MKKKLVMLVAVSVVMVMGITASAEVINTYNGPITVTPGTAPYDAGNVGTWLNVGDLSGAGVGYGTTYPYPGAPTPAVAGSTLDHFWVQSSTNELIYRLNTPASAVIGFPGNDHGPLPMENMEYMMWGTNNLSGSWTVGTLAAIYHDGWDSSPSTQYLEDWYATRWDFSGDFLYFKTVGTSGVVRGWTDYDPEMDGIAAVVPVPGAMLLGAIGLSVAGWRLRRKTT